MNGECPLSLVLQQGDVIDLVEKHCLFEVDQCPIPCESHCDYRIL